jgi:deaminated glutathione amidase
MRVAAVQMNVGERKGDNVALALTLVDEAAARGARLVVLPELMTYHGSPSRYPEVAETVPGPTSERFAAKAREHGCFIHGGSLVEPGPSHDLYYNTSYVLDPAGSLRAVYRKVHLFDVAVSREVSAHESRSIAPGDALVAVELPEFVLGLSTCYDLRFPELYRALAAAGAQVLAVPAAFREVTGRAHWEVLARARAIENHAYVIAAAQRGVAGGEVAMHGHSMIVDPWGSALAELPDGDGVIVAEVDVAEVERRRAQIPVLAARRTDVYERPVRVLRRNAPPQTA